MSFSGSSSNSKNQSNSQETSNSQSYYDPRQTDMIDSFAQGVAQSGQPGGPLAYTPYTGPGLTFGDPSALSGLTHYTAPTVGASTYNPSTVSTGQVNTDTADLMNPYNDQVVNATNADILRAKGIDDAGAASQATAAGAFGGSRSAVLQNLTDDSYARAIASADANLRQQGYTQAQGLAFGLGQGNQAAENAAASQNASQTQAASTANQAADLQAAQTKLQALGLNETQAQAIFGANWAQYLNSQTDPQQVQALINNAMGLVPTSPLSTSSSQGTANSTGSSSAFGFGFSAPK